MKVNPNPESPQSTPTGRSIRWWPLGLVVGLGVGCLWSVRYHYEANQQEQFIRTVAVGLITVLLGAVWFLFFSRLPWKVRWIGLSVGLGMAALLPALFEIRGVTGNLVPIFRWRWSEDAPPAYEVPRVTNRRAVAMRTLEETSIKRVDYPQFMGPSRDARLPGPSLTRDWVARPPREYWRRPVGAAWSGFAVHDLFAVTQEQRGEEECIVCYDLQSGRMIWSHADRERYFTTIAGEGPRATPTIDGMRVYALGATGLLNCLELASGRRVWSTNVVASNGATLNEWGMSGSPLVYGDLVVVSAGGKNGRSLVAYHKETGAMAWSGGNDHAGYSSPRLATLAGRTQILIFNSHVVAAHDGETGAVLWEYPWPKGHPHVALPVVLSEDQLFISSGYGTGAERLQVQRDSAGNWSAARLWKSMGMKAKFANPIFRAGFIYGLDDGILVCLDAATGERRWKEGRYGHGQMILVGDVLLIMAEAGEVVLVEASAEEHRELARFRALTGKTWNPPALAGPWLLVRNDLEAACFRLPLALETD